MIYKHPPNPPTRPPPHQLLTTAHFRVKKKFCSLNMMQRVVLQRGNDILGYFVAANETMCVFLIFFLEQFS